MDSYGQVHVHEGGLVTVGVQVPESVVSFTHFFLLICYLWVSEVSRVIPR
jgi:hypothetical protein